MRLFTILVIIGLVWLALVMPAHAQELPGTAAEGIDVLAALLATLAGLLATTVIDAIKNLSFFTDGERQKIADAYANLISVMVSVLTGYAVGYLAHLAGLLDSSGIWQLVLFSWPAAKGWFETGQLRRAIAKK
jgi:hypothetical protein